jgi:hypothetical protein
MTYPHFLASYKDLNTLMEGLNPGPFRSLHRGLGASKSDVDELQSLKLSTPLRQIVTVAHEQYAILVTDSDLIPSQWTRTISSTASRPCLPYTDYVKRMRTRHPYSTLRTIRLN